MKLHLQIFIAAAVRRTVQHLARNTIAALLLGALPGVGSAQSLPDSLELLGRVRQAMLVFNPQGDAIFDLMPTPPDSIWHKVPPTLKMLETGPDPWAWAGSAKSAMTQGTQAFDPTDQPYLLECARNSVAAVRNAYPDNSILDNAADAEVVTYCSVTLPVQSTPIPAELDRIVAALTPDFASVEVMRVGSGEPGMVLIAEGGQRGAAAIVDSMIVSLAQSDDESYDGVLMTLRVTALYFPPTS